MMEASFNKQTWQTKTEKLGKNYPIMQIHNMPCILARKIQIVQTSKCL